MPVLPPADGVTRAVLNYVWQGQRCANVLHFVADGGVDAPDPTELASRLATWWDVNCQQFTHSSCALSDINAVDLSSAGAPGIVYTLGLPISGTVAGTANPTNVTVVMSLKTALRGRSFRGRFYIVGLGNTQINNNALVSTQLTGWVNALNLLRTLGGDVGEPVFNLVVLSYYNNGAIRPVPVATPVANVVSDGLCDSQRRRLPGRGA